MVDVVKFIAEAEIEPENGNTWSSPSVEVVVRRNVQGTIDSGSGVFREQLVMIGVDVWYVYELVRRLQQKMYE